MDDDTLDTFEDLFEPFELEQKQEEPPVSTGEQPPVTAEPVAPATIYCTSCGSGNEPNNRHCEACGASLIRTRTPVAPQPMLRTTAGGRALLVLAGIVLTVAVLALVVNLFTGGDGDDDPAAVTSSSSTSLAAEPISELAPIRVDCNEASQLAAFPCEALVDGDPSTSWNAPDGGQGAEITFLFSPPVQITEIMITNLQDEERFLRNHRMQGIEILIDDLAQTEPAELDDTQEPQRIQIRSLRTNALTIRINTVYPAQSVGDLEPFRELAAQSVIFFGRASPEGGVTTTSSE